MKTVSVQLSKAERESVRDYFRSRLLMGVQVEWSPVNRVLWKVLKGMPTGRKAEKLKH